jgi:hypothetical protein
VFSGRSELREITNSMEQRPSWEADSHSASQEIPCLLCNPKVHYRVHKSPLPVPVLSQMNPVHTFRLYFPKTHSNIILPPTPMFSAWLYNNLNWDISQLSSLSVFPAETKSGDHGTRSQFAKSPEWAAPPLFSFLQRQLLKYSPCGDRGIRIVPP